MAITSVNDDMTLVGDAAQKRATPAERREWLLFVLLVGPNLLLFSIFTYWPLIYNTYLSFVRWDLLSPVKVWVGIENYRYLFTSPDFLVILRNTVVFTVATVVSLCFFGLIVALLLNRGLSGENFVRGVVFSPVMLTGSALSMIWLYIFDPRYGLLDVFISAVGLDSPDWFLSRFWSMVAIIIVHVWKNLGYAVVIYLAGLKAIPSDLYEAAYVDGADGWAQFRYVTLPGLAPVTFFLVLTTILSGFQSFDIIRVMTQGGPVNATTTLIYYLYEQGFIAYNAGRAGAAAVVLFVMMITITFLQMRFGDDSGAYD